jgi:hypothetical protein
MRGGSPALEDATTRIARKVPPHAGCGEIVGSVARLRQACRRSSFLALWHAPQALRSSSTDHHDFTRNATPGDLFSVSLGIDLATLFSRYTSMRR